MKLLWKCIYNSIRGQIVVTSVLLVTVLLSVWIIISTQLFESFKCPSHFTEEFCEKLNNILTNLAYSYLAAYMFYIITIWFPAIIKAYKMNSTIDQGMKNIKICIYNMYSMFHNTGNDGKIDMNDIDSICARMEKRNWMKPIFGPLAGGNLIQHLAYFSKTLNNTIVEFILLYKDNLSVKDLKGLNEIMNSNEYTLFDTLSRFEISNENCIVPINSFRQLLNVAKQYFKNLNT